MNIKKMNNSLRLTLLWRVFTKKKKQKLLKPIKMHKFKQCSFVFVWVVDLYLQKVGLMMEAIPKMSLQRVFVLSNLTFISLFIWKIHFRMRKIS